MREFFLKYWQLLLILGLSILVVWPLFMPGYFSHQDDLQVIRIFEMGKCLGDFQIPCRWTPDLAYGFGYPLFNFYNPTPYYLGAIARPLLGYIGSAKLLFFIPLFFAGITMYIFTLSIMDKKSALLAAILYTFAPYRAVDTYVRGAIGESFAILLAPLIFYFSFKIIKKRSVVNFLGLSLSLAFFLTSHNVSVVMWSPFIFGWFLIITLLNKGKNLKTLVTSSLIGVGLSAFFTIPAFLEKNLVSTLNLVAGSLDFRNNFVSYKDLFSRSWGYGATGLGPNIGLSFQIGWPQWILVIVFVVTIIIFRKRLEKEKIIYAGFFVLVFLLSVFMTHSKSTFVWLAVSNLKFVQFPWRFLSIVVFASSILGGMVLSFFSDKVSSLILIFLIALTVILNYGYFKPEKFFLDMTDSKKLSGEEWNSQVKGAAFDYLPLTAKNPVQITDNLVKTEAGEFIATLNKSSNKWSFNANLPKDSKIVVPVFYFPNWTVENGGQKLNSTYSNNGFIEFNLKKGASRVEGTFGNTPIRTFSNILSLISLLMLVVTILYEKNSKSTQQ